MSGLKSEKFTEHTVLTAKYAKAWGTLLSSPYRPAWNNYPQRNLASQANLKKGGLMLAAEND